MLAALVAAAATACGGAGDDGGEGQADPPTTVAPTVTDAPATTTTAPADCDELAEAYLDTFFALGAGTPRDPEATTVELPVAELLAIDRQAADAGCRDFVEVACSAYAELAARGLETTNSDPPASC